MYIKQIDIRTPALNGSLYITDDVVTAKELKNNGEAVIIYFHDGNKDVSFSGFLYGVENPEELEPEYLERVYRRLKGLPWEILETERCLVRETTVADVDAFFEIYSEPSITEYTEGLYTTKEKERDYIREYIDKFYTFYEYGVWTIVEKESGAIIGRAGFSARPECDNPELGFVIGLPWQQKGYAFEVCKAILEFGWETLGFEGVQALVEPENKASIALCEKLGFRQIERVTLQDEKKEYVLLIIFKPSTYTIEKV